MSQFTDTELIALIIDTSDPRYITLLYERHTERVQATCLYWLKDAELAADCTQDIFVKVFQKLDSFNHQSSFVTWLTAVARNYCTDILRQQRRLPLHLSLEEGRLDADRLGLHEHNLEVIDLLPYLHQLKPEDQQLLHLKYEEEVTIEDLATHLDITLSAVKMRLKRARMRLKEVYERSTMGKP